MRTVNSLLARTRSHLARPSSNSQTEAGPQDSSMASAQYSERKNTEPTPEHLDAINQVFAELKLAYHNQFHRAYPNDRELAMAKQLWLYALSDLPPARLRAGVRRAIRGSDYLPSLHALRGFCSPQPSELGLPEAYAAYIEACRAPSPKAAHHWSHPIVYRAGGASDWFFLANSPESQAFPVFKRNYELLLERVLNGEELDVPLPKALPQEVQRPLSQEERKQRMKKLRDELNI